MKKLFLALLFIFSLAIGCKKDNKIQDEQPAQGSMTVENKPYKTIIAGDLEWTAENYDGSYGVYYNDEVNHAYGKLLSLHDTRNLSKQLPSGWRIPTVKDYVNLINLYGGFVTYNSTGVIDNKVVDQEIKAEALLSIISNSEWSAKGNNKSGFNLLPSGYSDRSLSFAYRGEGTALWTSDVYSNTYYTPMLMGVFSEQARIEGSFAEYAQALQKVTDDSRGKGSVRLVRDR